MGEETQELAQELASRTTTLTVVETLCLSIINVTAFVGNVLVCLAVYHNSRLRTIPNMFVVALAMNDMLMSSFCMPFSVATLALGEWRFGKPFCGAHGFGVFTLAQISLHTMVLISVSRYFCVVRRNQFATLFSKRRTLLYITVLWCFDLTNSLPPFFFKVGFEFQPGKAMCLYTFEAVIGYTAYMYILCFFTPLLLLVVCYAKVFREVSRTNKVFSQENNIQNLRVNVEEAKVTKTLVTVMVGFSLCWLPVSIIDFIDTARGKPTLPRQLYLLYGSSLYLSSGINPFIYGALNSTFKREYYRYVNRIFCFKTGSETSIAPMNSEIKISELTRGTQEQSVEMVPIDQQACSEKGKCYVITY